MAGRYVEWVCARPGCDCLVLASPHWKKPQKYCSPQCAARCIGDKLRNPPKLAPAWTVLSEQEVREIRASQENDRVLAKRLGVSATAVREARVGKTWRYLT